MRMGANPCRGLIQHKRIKKIFKKNVGKRRKKRLKKNVGKEHVKKSEVKCVKLMWEYKRE